MDVHEFLLYINTNGKGKLWTVCKAIIESKKEKEKRQENSSEAQI